MAWLWARVTCICVLLPSFYSKLSTHSYSQSTTNWIQKLGVNISGEWSIQSGDTINVPEGAELCAASDKNDPFFGTLFEILHSTTEHVYVQRLNKDMNQFKTLLDKAKRIVVITGSGISAESGIPTFRGDGGWWRKNHVAHIANLESFKENPGRVWAFYNYRRTQAARNAPNMAHYALVRLEEECIRRNKSFVLFTQNVDGYHQAAGSHNVIELHGNLWRTRCTWCEKVEENRNIPIVPVLDEKICNPNASDVWYSDEDLNVNDLPRCSDKACGGLLRPDIVWFGEQLNPQYVKMADKFFRNAEMGLVIGSSNQVYPAAGWPQEMAAFDIPVAEFNTQINSETRFFKFFFQGKVTQTLPQALGIPPEECVANPPSHAHTSPLVFHIHSHKKKEKSKKTRDSQHDWDSA